MALTSNLRFDVPGVYVTEDAYGAVPASLASFGTVYMLGTSVKANAPKDTITFVSSVADFTNVFGISPSSASVELFFEQRSGSGLYFINVSRREQRAITILSVTTGDIFYIFIGAQPVSVTAVDGDTQATILAKFTKEMNVKYPQAAYIVGNVLSTIPGLTEVSCSGLVALTPVRLPDVYPTGYDVAHTINIAFDPDMRQGYLIAPEFFQNIVDQGNRAVVANAMEAFAADPEYNWMALIDCGTAVATGTAVGIIPRVTTERNIYSSPKGHGAYFFPYWKNALNTVVPMSASVAGVALRAYRAKGFQQPPAGTTLPVYGVIDATFNVSTKVQAVLNPIGINCGRRLPAGRGIVIYGSRTLSTNQYYRFITTRVIMNVLAGTLKRSFDDFVFSSVDGLGILFSRVKLTCMGICELMRTSGALYGATPEEAYLVTCDATNNPALDLEDGKVTVDVVVKPSPILETLGVRLSRASLGTTLVEAISSGSTSPANNAAKQEQK